MFALRGSYWGCTQLALKNAFRFGSRLSGYLIRMANTIKPSFCFYYSVDIRMANPTKPMCVLFHIRALSGWQTQ